ncbi:MAG: hypothetical protein FWH17_10875, partial [Oscillospiraceae bacterium]|nr:hypothetical protein [Oscillospiraceae bacterium]
MRIIKKTLAMLLAAALLTGIVPASVYAAGLPTITVKVEEEPIMPLASSGSTIDLEDTYLTGAVTGGTGWTYNHAEKRYDVNGDVTVIGNVTGATEMVTIVISGDKTVTWNANLSGTVSTGNSTSMHGMLQLAGTGAFDVVSGLIENLSTVSNNYGLYMTGGNASNLALTVSGGTVKAGNNAIYAPGTGSFSVTITSGKVESTGSAAILTNSSDVTMSGGEVTGYSQGIVCRTLTMSGGTVTATATTVGGDAVMVRSGTTTISGGTIYAPRVAISGASPPTSSTIDITGGLIYSTGTNPAIYIYNVNNLTVSGGFIYSRRASVAGISSTSVIHHYDTGASFAGAAGDAVIAGWSGSGTAFADGSAANLVMSPAGGAYWDNDAGSAGIRWSSGANTGFYPIAGVTVTAVTITIDTQPAANTTVVYGGIPGSLSVTASSSPPVTLDYQWYSNTTNSNTSGTLIPGATNASFTIPTNLTEGTYYYYCVVGGAANVASTVATVTVNAPVITINTQPADAAFVQGEILGILNISASVTGGATLGYQWYSNSTNSNSGGTLIPGATNASFTIPTDLMEGTYYYYCIVSAANGAVSVPSDVATVTVGQKAVSVGAQNVTVTAGLGGNVEFPVATEIIGDGVHNITVNNLPNGVTVVGGMDIYIANNTGVLYLHVDSNVTAGTFSNLTLTFDGVTSAAFTLTIDDPLGKIATVGEQQGAVTAGTGGEVYFPVNTLLIDDDDYAITVDNLPTGVTILSANDPATMFIQDNAGGLWLHIDTSAAEGIYDNLTLTIDGATSNPFTLTIDPPSPPALGWDGSPGSFADLTYGYTAGSAVTYTIRNTGNQTLTGITAAITAGGDNFEISTPLSATTLAPNATATVTVRSATGLGVNAAAYTGTLTISATDAAAITQSLSQTVNKATGLTATAPTITIPMSDTTERSFDLNSIVMIPNDHGTRSYTSGAFTDSTGILSGTPALSGTNDATLTYQGTGASSGSATLVITIESQNYENINVTINFEATALVQTIAFPNSNAGVTKTYGDTDFTNLATLESAGGDGEITYSSSDTTVAT